MAYRHLREPRPLRQGIVLWLLWIVFLAPLVVILFTQAHTLGQLTAQAAGAAGRQLFIQTHPGVARIAAAGLVILGALVGKRIFWRR